MARKRAANGSGTGVNTVNLGYEPRLCLVDDTATHMGANPQLRATRPSPSAELNTLLPSLLDRIFNP